MSNTILSVSHLATSFRTKRGWKPILHNISFDIAPRETLAVVGESGSGKSVTALSIMRLNKKNTTRVGGTIKLFDRDLLSLPEKDMRSIRGNQIAMIFQEPMTSLNPVLTVGTQIAETLTLHRGMSRTSAEMETVRLLEKVRIPGAKTRILDYPHQLSGGMRQRVMIATALACKPSLLIADEPTTALDVTVQAQILDLIKELQAEEGMAVLFITHDMGVVAEIADRTIVMYRGRTVEAGPTDRIFHEPKESYTRALLASVPKLGSMNGKPSPMSFPTVDPKTGEICPGKEIFSNVKSGASPLLEVKGLTKRFDVRSGLFSAVKARIHAVQDVSFTLQAGETLSLVGESGCGKSTTGRMIAQLIEASSGTVSFDGLNSGTSGEGLRDYRKRMQMVFQDPFASLHPRLTVAEAIREPIVINRLMSRGQAGDRVVQLLEQVGLSSDFGERLPHELSGGQRQRVCIARALALEPRLIVADEAVSALDVSVKAQVVNLMLELQARLGLAYLFISHDMAAVERISHRVAVMYRGEIVEIGARQAIFQNAQHSYTKRLLSAVPIADPKHRNRLRPAIHSELTTALRASDFIPKQRRYKQISSDHIVMVEDDE